jgi:triosephosphate isomerase (TIM)
MRTKIIAGNWKMNGLKQDAQTLTSEINGMLKDEVNSQHTVILSPPFPFIAIVAQLASDSRIHIAAQNCSSKSSGAFTGEVSPAMIRSAGADHIIVGHSERRTYYHEDDVLLAEKIKLALENDCTPIFCCGETLEQRNSGHYFETVAEQLKTGLFHLSEKDIYKAVIAYEPVWAIGTGVTASPQQAQEMHAYIRKLVSEKYSAAVADKISILYGGSCNEQNAEELFALPDVDGGLIGGASLKSRSFVNIIKAMKD